MIKGLAYGGKCMSGLFNFLKAILKSLLDFFTAILKPDDKKDPSIIVKNYNINKNSNQNTNNSANKKNSQTENKGKNSRKSKPQGGNVKSPMPQKSSQSQIRVKSVRLYSTGVTGKIYTDRFYKSINHNFGIEVVIANGSPNSQTVNLSHCIYDEKGSTVASGNFHPRINAHTQYPQYIYVKPQMFDSMEIGKYKSQFWLNDKRVQKAFFTIANK